MLNSDESYKMLVFTRRVKTPGIMETMSEQVPEVKIAFSEIDAKLKERLQSLGEANWRVISHAQNIHNGILIISVMLEAKALVEG